MIAVLERYSKRCSLREGMGGGPAERRNSIVSVESTSVDEEDSSIAKGGVAVPFPWKVHKMLDAAREEGLEHVVSWQPHDRSFTVHKPKVFVELLMTRYVKSVSKVYHELNLLCSIRTRAYLALVSSITGSFRSPSTLPSSVS
jgi:hypothetical protein